MKYKYKKLINNSIIFTIGNFGSKLMSFVMIPVYSYYLSTSDYGKVDLLTSLVSLLLPIVFLDIYDAVLRYALDKAMDKTVVLNSGIYLSCLSSMVILFLGFVLSLFIINYPVMLTSILLIVSGFYSVISNFARALDYAKQFAVAGIINSIVLGVGNIVLLVIFKSGMNGYLISMILGQLVAILYLFFSTEIKKEVHIKLYDTNLLHDMLVYGLPLIPNSLAWWLNSSSDRFFIIGMLGASANGIYAMASKIPAVISTINGIFFQSWQISVVEEYEKEDGDKFISSVFDMFISVLFLISFGIIAIIRPIYRFVLSGGYYYGWKLTPALVLAVLYTSISSFLGTIYTANKKTTSVLVTTIYGAIINVILTIILIKFLGVNGAAIANAVSFMVVSFFRYKEIHKMGKINLNKKSFIMMHTLFFALCLTLFLCTNDIVVFVVGMAIIVFSIFFNKNIRFFIKKLVNKIKFKKI